MDQDGDTIGEIIWLQNMGVNGLNMDRYLIQIHIIIFSLNFGVGNGRLLREIKREFL